VSTTSGTGNSPGNNVFAILDTSTTSVTRDTAGAGNLQINMTGFGYTNPAGLLKSFKGDASYTSSLFSPGDTVRSDFWVDPNGAGANVNNLNCTISVGVTAFGCAAGSLLWNDNGGSFSIRSLQTYNVATNGSVNVTSTGIVKNAVPEPATLSLVGLALLGAGFAGRRAAKKA
jgi:PEP-CTERM motif